jgi:pimeloyl-ACP methyl ester carboxylesterase
MSRTIVTLRNREGHALHCILEEPPQGLPRPGVAAVLLCPGIKTRVGPHRLYRKVSPPFLARGIPVLRVDFRGLGDSEGEWPDESLASIYRLTELGHCVDDVRSALDWLESRLGIRRCIVGGLCGAAITALHVAREDPRLAALYAIGLPARLDGTGEEPRVTAGELQSHRSVYFRKLLQPASWLRLLSLKTDYGLLWRALRHGLLAKKTAVSSAAGGATTTAGLNPHLPECLLALLGDGRPALVLFGERDPMRWSFEENVLQPWAAALEPYQAQIQYSVIPGANHILSRPADIVEANRLTEAWLDAQFTTSIGRLERGASLAGIHPRAVECSGGRELIVGQASIEAGPGG